MISPLMMEKSVAQPHYYHSTCVRVARPEGCRVEQIYPRKEALLYRDRKFLSAIRHELSGQWSGFCTVASDPQPLALSFRLHFEAASVRGDGQDSVGSFTLEGCYRDTDMSLHLTKKYTTHSVEYHGHYKGDRTFSGEWAQPTAKGFFELTKELEPDKGLLPCPAELADNDHSFIWSLETETNLVGDWVGHCTQDSDVYDLTLSLVFNKGSVSGQGSDMAGKFTWSGMFDAREMHISLIKLYPTHRVYFNGFYLANKTFEGDWVIDDHAHGIFRVAKT